MLKRIKLLHASDTLTALLMRDSTNGRVVLRVFYKLENIMSDIPVKNEEDAKKTLGEIIS